MEPVEPDVWAKTGADRPRHSAAERARIVFMVVSLSNTLKSLKPEDSGYLNKRNPPTHGL